MPSFTLTHLTVPLPHNLGYQKRALLHDAATGQPICQRIGGLRYAHPLDASQRWKRARSLLPEDLKYGTKSSPTDLTGLANECPQPLVSGHDMPRQNEDCLMMNVYVPLGEPPRGEGWPVFFYICTAAVLFIFNLVLLRLPFLSLLHRFQVFFIYSKSLSYP